MSRDETRNGAKSNSPHIQDGRKDSTILYLIRYHTHICFNPAGLADVSAAQAQDSHLGRSLGYSPTTHKRPCRDQGRSPPSHWDEWALICSNPPTAPASCARSRLSTYFRRRHFMLTNQAGKNEEKNGSPNDHVRSHNECQHRESPAYDPISAKVVVK